MPTTKKKKTNRWPGETIPRQFRLTAETLAELDAITDHLRRTSGIDHSRTDSIRYAVRQVFAALPENKSEKSSK